MREWYHKTLNLNIAPGTAAGGGEKGGKGKKGGKGGKKKK